MWAFADFTLAPNRFELRRAGEVVHLEPQVFDVLALLVSRHGTVVTRTELLDRVWGTRFVADATLASRIRAARQALGDHGDEQRFIRTLRGRGYEFVAPVTHSPDAAGAARPPQDPASEPMPAWASPAVEPRFCRGSDGVRIAYALTGSGPPLVKAANWMTHLGHDLDSPVWRHWLSALAAEHTLVRYDERGCGLSEWQVEDFSLDAWVADLEAVVDDAGLDRFALLGISQGAAVAIAYAVRHPERVSALVLVSGYPAGRGARATSDDLKAAARLDIELASVGWGRSDSAFRRVFAVQFFPDGPPELWDAFDDLQRQTVPPENAPRFLAAFGALDVRHLAPAVTRPTLILHGRDDQRVPFEQARALHALIPDSRLVPLPTRNHLLTEDEPAWPVLLDEIRSFLAQST